jgi:hypothetical protein
MIIVPLRKDPPLQGTLQPVGFVLFQGVQVVQTAEKEQVGDLLHDFQGIGNAAGPEGIPDAVYLIADIAGKHEVRIVLSFTKTLNKIGSCRLHCTCE